MPEIKIGLIGGGWIADKAHIPAFLRLPQVTISGIYEPDAQRAAVLAGKFRIPCTYESLNELLQSDVHAVVVSTPNHTHYTIALQALEHGKHVLCEKPVVLSVREMEKIMHAASMQGKVFMPAFVNRFRDDIVLLSNLLAEGRLGVIQSVQAGWVRKNGIPRPGTWITNRQLSGGGVLVDLGSHLLDICLMMLKERKPLCADVRMEHNYEDDTPHSARLIQYEAVQPLAIDVERSVNAAVDFEKDIRLSVELSWAAPVANDFTYFHIAGTKGYLNLKTLFGFSKDRMYVQDRCLMRTRGHSPVEIALDPLRNAQQHAFERMAAHFVDCIAGEAVPLITMEDGLRTVSLIEMLYSYTKN